MPGQVVVSADVNAVPPEDSIHKAFSSTPNLKKEGQKEQPQTTNGSNNRESSNDVVGELNRRNAAASIANNKARDDLGVIGANNSVDQQRGYFTLPGRGGRAKRRAASQEESTQLMPFQLTPTLPPPDHPPPPPPSASSAQVVALGKSDYATVNGNSNPSSSPSPAKSDRSNDNVRSSFKPSDSAKLYASPENVQSVGFRAGAAAGGEQQQAVKKRSPTRANSMPPRPNRPQVLRRSMIAEIPMSGSSSSTNKETYSVNGVNYTTYTTFR